MEFIEFKGLHLGSRGAEDEDGAEDGTGRGRGRRRRRRREGDRESDRGRCA